MRKEGKTFMINALRKLVKSLPGIRRIVQERDELRMQVARSQQPGELTRLVAEKSHGILELFSSELREIDKKMIVARPSEIPGLFNEIPLDVFGRLLLDIPAGYPHIKGFFPSMASDEVQRNWTGSSGEALLSQSKAFVKSLLFGYISITGKKTEDMIVLDYGCGWGRLIRLLYKFVSFENIYAVDPWDQSIDQCQKHGVKANLAISDWVPKTLPFERKFDLVFAFSVFTHLSEKTAHVVLDTLRKYVTQDGLLVITIWPKEYWNHHPEITGEMIKLHDERGFAFKPHDLPPIDGDITYGDTSMSLEYIHRHFRKWKLARVDYNSVDPYQVVLFLQPASGALTTDAGIS